jgi:lysophospholipase L1-like esterase
MRITLITVLLVAALVVIYDATIIVRALLRGSEIAARSQPFRVAPDRFRRTMLIVGDSTAVGTGAESPEDSIAGRIAADFPSTRIDNLGRNGALTRAVTEQLRSAPRDRYDLVLIQIGGNDALRFTAADTLRKHIDAALDAATERGQHVGIMSTGRLGVAPALPWPLAPLLTWRSEIVRGVFMEAAAEHGARYVDLFVDPGHDNPFLEEPHKYHADDGLHPSSSGYGAWYAQLRRQLPIEAWLMSP